MLSLNIYAMIYWCIYILRFDNQQENTQDNAHVAFSEE